MLLIQEIQCLQVNIHASYSRDSVFEVGSNHSLCVHIILAKIRFIIETSKQIGTHVNSACAFPLNVIIFVS